jgi:hypothetical protein
MAPGDQPQKAQGSAGGRVSWPIVDLIRLLCYIALHVPCVVSHSGWVGGIMLRATRQLYVCPVLYLLEYRRVGVGVQHGHTDLTCISRSLAKIERRHRCPKGLRRRLRWD